MTSHFSNPPHLIGSPQPAIYRPRYRQRTANPSHVLDRSKNVAETLDASLMTPLQALEEWRAQDEERGQDTSVRWHPQKLKALALYIEPPQHAAWIPILIRACREWESASGGLVQLVSTVRPQQADIHVTWSASTTEGRPFEVGHTRRSVQSANRITHAAITLLIAPEIDRHLPMEEIEHRLYTTMLHELGHALGLEHSPHAKDIMHHQGWRNRQLSPNDSQRLQTLYATSSPITFWL